MTIGSYLKDIAFDLEESFIVNFCNHGAAIADCPKEKTTIFVSSKWVAQEKRKYPSLLTFRAGIINLNGPNQCEE